MNREQAINYLICRGFTHEQVGEVVRALTYEPTTKNDLGVDCISRADAIKAIIEYQYSDGFCEEHNIDHSINTSMALLALSDLPSVTPQLSVPEVTALAEWTEKLTKASEDAYNKGYADGRKEQESRKGHWIKQNDDYFDWYECSECGYGSEGEMQYSSEYDVRTNYCPNCGADMREAEE